MKQGIACLLFSMIFIFAKAQNANDIVGVWWSEDKDAKIEIINVQNKYQGKLVWLKEPYEADGKTIKTDKKNPKEQLRNRTLQNLVILTDLEFKDGKWSKGEIYDPKSGKTYSCEAKLDGNKLRLRGYIGFSLLGRTSVFTRAS